MTDGVGGPEYGIPRRSGPERRPLHAPPPTLQVLRPLRCQNALFREGKGGRYVNTLNTNRRIDAELASLGGSAVSLYSEPIGMCCNFFYLKNAEILRRTLVSE